MVALDAVLPNPDQPRRQLPEEGLMALAASIREVGVLQPIVVRPEEGGTYVLVAGERRLRAARLAGLDEIPMVVRQQRDGGSNLTEALIENLQREDLSPLEEASAYQQLLDDHGLTHEDVAARVGKSRSAVTNMVRLLQLPAPLQGMLERGELSTGHVRALLGLDDEAYAVHLAERAAAEGWSVRQIEESVRARTPATRTTRPKEVRPAAIIELEQRLAERLSTKVSIDVGARGGKVVVRFSGLDDLERIYRHLFT
jgi:ParB family chromosome partitioning protein